MHKKWNICIKPYYLYCPTWWNSGVVAVADQSPETGYCYVTLSTIVITELKRLTIKKIHYTITH